MMAVHSRSRRVFLIVAGLAIAIAGGIALRVSLTSNTAPRVAAELSDGAAFADSLERALGAAPADSVSDGAAIVALYLERLRLGLGSPFRLIDYALRDPLVPPESRRLLAKAILARAGVGQAYETPPEALDLIAPRPASGSGELHRRFMEDVTQEAESPRVAELALRLAYTIGASSGAVSHRAAAIAVSAAAQARDRALAMRDVDALVREARRQKLDVVDLVPLWRASRRFLVERPLTTSPAARDEDASVRLLPALLARLDSLHAADSAPPRTPVLSPATAAAAANLAIKRAAPPQAPVAVTVTGYASFVVGGARSPVDRTARSGFVARARTEEGLAAELARLRAASGSVPEASLAAMTAAVALRPYAQERAWLPGDDGPPALELQSRLGLASLTFDPQVPARWRPYYTRMLDEVVYDLRLVFPGLDLSGLNVRFGESPLADRALALHDPKTRTVFFPLATSAGAMAHELAHDLDWQAARKTYGVRGGYRTDRSVKQYHDNFSLTVRRLASAGRPRRGSLSSPVQADRPTEAFARGADWFVATTLAQHGRMNGYLSAVQDEVLTGYASATAPRGRVMSGEATLAALREITAIDPAMITWYDSSYGTGARVDVFEAVRRTLTAPLPRLDVRGDPPFGFEQFGATTRAFRASPEASSGWACQLAAPSLAGRDIATVRLAMFVTAEARARGLVRRWGDHARDTPGSAWRFRALAGAPWDPATSDSLVREVRDGILWRAARIDDGRPGVDFAERIERSAVGRRCGMAR